MGVVTAPVEFEPSSCCPGPADRMGECIGKLCATGVKELLGGVQGIEGEGSLLKGASLEAPVVWW